MNTTTRRPEATPSEQEELERCIWIPTRDLTIREPAQVQPECPR
jgi:hypothetical protein